MNRIILMGRLTKDPEVRVTPSDKTVCTFGLAVPRAFAKDETDFINIVAWGKTAELCGNSLSKGERVLLEGRLQIRGYKAKDGSNRSVTEVIADRMEFVEKKKADSPMAAMGTESQHDEEVPF